MPIQKILLVDDSKTELHALSEMLTKRGFIRFAPLKMVKMPGVACRKKTRPDPDGCGHAGANGFQLTRAITRDLYSPMSR